jgi:hypothetical protein
MGGQACVFYGAAEFSRDLDLVVLADDDNLERLRNALADLAASPVAIPPFDFAYLARGHALHFRCTREDVRGLRIDVMSNMRGVASFDDLWERRTSIEVDGERIELLGFHDLVTAKKTQRSKDWPMIQRLVEQVYFTSGDSAEQIEFLLRELRTPELLISLSGRYPDAAQRVRRPAADAALRSDIPAVEAALHEEEMAERARDRAYWEPLKRELEQLRRARH